MTPSVQPSLQPAHPVLPQMASQGKKGTSKAFPLNWIQVFVSVPYIISVHCQCWGLGQGLVSLSWQNTFRVKWVQPVGCDFCCVALSPLEVCSAAGTAPSVILHLCQQMGSESEAQGTLFSSVVGIAHEAALGDSVWKVVWFKARECQELAQTQGCEGKFLETGTGPSTKLTYERAVAVERGFPAGPETSCNLSWAIFNTLNNHFLKKIIYLFSMSFASCILTPFISPSFHICHHEPTV